MALPEHRASDADRDRVAAVLRDAHAEGRLDVDELTERLDATYASRTYGELAALTQDLPVTGDRPSPAPAPTPVPASAPAVPGPVGRPPVRRTDRDLRGAWAAWGVAVSVNVVIWLLVAITSGPVYFWPMWVAGPWGAVLLVLTVAERGRRR
jgi:hypothetical protein